MKKSEFKINIHCGKCKQPLRDHPRDLINGEYVIRRFGMDCPRKEVEFD